MQYQVPAIRSDAPAQFEASRYVSQPLGMRNPDPAHLLAICWDNSGSTGENGGIEEQNRLLKQISEDLKDERSIGSTVLVATAAFGRRKPFEVRSTFAPPDQLDLEPLTAETGTPHCQRVSAAVEFVTDARRILATHCERELRTSWLFDFTDGRSEDIQFLSAAIEASKVKALRENIHIFFFGIGSDCDMDYLQKLAQPGRPAVHVRTVESFRRFFEWLNVSLVRYRCSRPGQTVELPSFEGGPRLVTEG